MTPNLPQCPCPQPMVVLALGSNLGDSVALIRRAMNRLETLAHGPLRRSGLWRTTPVDCPPGSPDFVNAVVAFTAMPDETPESLLERTQAIEREFGRPQSQPRHAPRPLDLDLIAFGLQRRQSPRLTLPHPRAPERRFVLEPLAEIAPALVLPGQDKSVAELLATLGNTNPAQRTEPYSPL